METHVDEIADRIYRLSTYVEPADLTFNQYLVLAEEPLLFHCGGRQLFPLVNEAAARVMPVDRLRWISFGHVESDECGSMNSWLQAAPTAQVVHGTLGVMVSLADLADRPPRALADGEVIDLGDRTVRWLDTSHVPHGWESGLLYEEQTRTLFCGDLFTQAGRRPALSESDIVEPAVLAEGVFHATALTPDTGPAIRRLADLAPATLALMHGPAFGGDTGAALRDLAGFYDASLAEALAARAAG
ncbi:MBL fold metallo-hydrolase [Pseudonocardia acidicola]|uniref:MBL fold metallo-hydrolase n=1 Tax=Pseudonocardia acidicola TaxID=2724939 RepID=A0ABX1SJ79_9PSEU|nr:MBL fold metallo-hydrolase [Pseudonocardia acidicola]NMI01010.1 MBL fold metallo-hydrolase [Pseudonocardia acidicola]